MAGRRDVRIVATGFGLSALGDWLAITPLALELQRMTAGLAMVVRRSEGGIRGVLRPQPEHHRMRG